MCSGVGVHSCMYQWYQWMMSVAKELILKKIKIQGLLHSHTQLFCHIWRIIDVTEMNHHLVPNVFGGLYVGTLNGQSITSTSSFLRKSLVVQAVWWGALSLTKTKLFWKVVLAQGKRLCCSTCLYIWLVHSEGRHNQLTLPPWASSQIRKIAGCACAGNTGNVFPHRQLKRKPLVSDPVMHHGTCRDACRDRLPMVAGKTFPAFPAHSHSQFYVSAPTIH